MTTYLSAPSRDVNETLAYETETRPRHLETTSRDRLETETSRPRLHPWHHHLTCHQHDNIPPSLHDGLHVVNARITADVRRLKSLVDLCSLLQLHHLLGSLPATLTSITLQSILSANMYRMLHSLKLSSASRRKYLFTLSNLVLFQQSIKDSLESFQTLQNK